MVWGCRYRGSDTIREIFDRGNGRDVQVCGADRSKQSDPRRVITQAKSTYMTPESSARRPRKSTYIIPESSERRPRRSTYMIAESLGAPGFRERPDQGSHRPREMVVRVGRAPSTADILLFSSTSAEYYTPVADRAHIFFSFHLSVFFLSMHLAACI